MATFDGKDFDGNRVALEKPLAPGRAAAASSRPVALSSEDFAVIDGLETLITATNALLTTQAAYLDGLETLIAATNTKLDTANTSLAIIDDQKTKIINNAGTVVDPVAAVGGGVPVISGGYEYETVAASQTAQALGATGAVGDYIAGILVIPATTSPGAITLLDNAISITVFVGGATSVSNLVPFFIPLGLISVSGAWKITTGANVSCIGCGNFT